MSNQTSTTTLFLDNPQGEHPPSYEEAITSSPPRPASTQQRQQTPQHAAPNPACTCATHKPQQFPYSNAQAGCSATVTGTIARQFPATFNLYHDGWDGSFTIGEQQAAPIHTVRLHAAGSAEPPVVLYAGPKHDTSHRLASVDIEPGTGHMTVTLPPLQGAGPDPSTERVQADPPGWHRVYRFAIEVGVAMGGPAAARRRELFEWRHSADDAIAGIGGTSHWWKLVRLESGPPPGVKGQFAVGRHLASDGREVVAVWSDATMSVSKRAKFAFLGTARTGLFGERWAVMTVISALGIWEKERRARIQG